MNQQLHLANGTIALTRPITAADGEALTRGLGRLSPAGHAYRFLQYRKRFSSAELHYLTHCDFVDHLALILAILDHTGREIDQVGVARSIRTPEDPELAEVAIVVVDEYQGLGGGTALLRHLARLAWQTGVRRWLAFSLEDNVAALHLLEKIGPECSHRRVGAGAIETIYELPEP
jgi:GNAT superfamily N-acetyltransferase